MVLSESVLKIIASCVSGFITGMGLGGGIILIPIFVMLGTLQKEAQIINLICYIPISLVISLVNAKKELIDRKIVFHIFIYAIIGGVVGAILAINADVKILKNVLGIIMILIGIMEIKKCMKKDL